MHQNGLNIKFILLSFIVVIALTLIFFVTIFLNKQSQLQNQLTYFQLQQTAVTFAQQLDKEIELAQRHVRRLKGYLSILDFENSNYRLMVRGYDAITREYNNIHYITLVVQMGGDGLPNGYY